MSRLNEKDKFIVRLPDGMRERIAGKAKEAMRSMNSEIIYRLGNSLEVEAENMRLKAMLDHLLQNQQPSNLAEGQQA